ncbi:hypothetical protein S7711_04247 [Stachybotrys chartarum IBT 7711]|uniref:Autophagy-related protein 14 n=1 Tax=Stachybotrys chartarum (strain CBS 109288 / IBT 7711) TaxID=1280523 RepID=A0A084AIM8_STACB|nr:hypothetical protein S7711_04247 [Stachybotrys chartarum IBT 7711]KFA76196.1 hypothetical protein S40288_07274 [Stachybotrys chartarum IBT 40288]
MECDICHRGYDAHRLPFLCPVDARNRVYEARMRNAQLLLQNEALQKQINDLLAGTPAKPNRDTVDKTLALQRTEEDRTDQILAAADRLREEVKAARADIQAKRTAVARRRADLAAVSQGLAERREKLRKDVDKATQVIKHRWSDRAEDMARTRSFLCAEAARLYGLRRVRKGNSSRYEYYLGKLPVVDLATMNTLSPEVISTSLGHISHTLMLASHYLAVRLPAEITLPHRDYPRPTIFSIINSYQHGEVAFPLTSATALPAAEHHANDSRTVSRPRPLFIDKPLPQLAKEDPSTYSYFLEGVVLLAYDISWLCCSQGAFVGDKGSFDDICNMGRNLYNLLINQQPLVPTDFPTNLINQDPHGPSQSSNPPPASIGHYSHGTMYNYLGGAQGTELIKSFKLPSPVKLVDKLKKKLVGDGPAPDWEVLEDDEWKIEEAPGNVVEDSKNTTAAKRPDAAGSPRTASNGWMKLKNR